MKKFYALLTVYICIAHLSYAQWSPGAGTVFLTTISDKVGIGTVTPNEKLTVSGNVQLGGTVPYLALLDGAWGTQAYIQAGVDPVGNTTGNYLTFENPSGKGFSFSHGGVSKMVIDPSSGNVGVGTTSPSQRFTVVMDGSTNGTGVAVQAVNSSAAGSQPGFAFLNPSGTMRMNSYLDVSSDTYNIGNAAGSSLMTINQSGKVGIGTTSPATLLQVAGTASVGVDGTTQGQLTLWSATAASEGNIYGVTGGGILINTHSNSYPIELDGSKVIMGMTGYVGIGTSSPNAPLEVNGNIRNSTPSQLVLTNSVDVLSASSNASLFASSANANVSIATGISTGNVKIGPSAGGIAVLGSGSGGFVGIGTASPDEMLTVNGTVHSTEVKVTTSVPLPDYVFKPNYRLPKLTEVQSYINANHHLPEIPAAAQMEANGIALGEMNTKLLKKVEELTLYLIGQEKTIKSMQQQINKLKLKTPHKNLGK